MDRGSGGLSVYRRGRGKGRSRVGGVGKNGARLDMGVYQWTLDGRRGVYSEYRRGGDSGLRLVSLRKRVRCSGSGVILDGGGLDGDVGGE